MDGRKKALSHIRPSPLSPPRSGRCSNRERIRGSRPLHPPDHRMGGVDRGCSGRPSRSAISVARPRVADCTELLGDLSSSIPPPSLTPLQWQARTGSIEEVMYGSPPRRRARNSPAAVSSAAGAISLTAVSGRLHPHQDFTGYIVDRSFVNRLWPKL